MSLVLVSSLCFTTTVFAGPINKGQPLNIKENNINGIAKIGNNQTVVSGVLTFDQMVERIAIDNNITRAEAANRVRMNSNDTSLHKIINKSLTTTLAENPTYRVVSCRFTVTDVYKPTLNFYCETTEGGYFWGINKILDVQMNRSYNGISKQFSGSVYTHLENGGSIYWVVNGDFYNNGMTTVQGAGEIGMGKYATINFSVSYQLNHYSYCYETGYYKIGY